MVKKLTEKQISVLSTALIFAEKNHPHIGKQIRNLWSYLFQIKEDFSQLGLDFNERKEEK